MAEVVEHPTTISRDYAGLRKRIVRCVYRMCPQALRDDAEDLVQESLIRIFRRDGATATPPALTNSYLNKVAYCVMIDEMRRRRLPLDAATEVIEQHPAEDPLDQPEQQALGRELGHGIAECIRELNLDRARATTLYLLGHSVPDAARVLGQKPKATENLVYRSLAQLRKCLRGKGLST